MRLASEIGVTNGGEAASLQLERNAQKQGTRPLGHGEEEKWKEEFAGK